MIPTESFSPPNNMAKKKLKRNTIQLWVSLVIFLTFTTVLFVNNLSDLLSKYSVQYPISLITWIGLVGSVLYGLFLVIYRKSLK